MSTGIIKKVTLLSLAGVLTGIGVAGSVVCYQNAGIITNYLSPAKSVAHDVDVQETLSKSDELIQKIASEGITLLKNDGILPLINEKNARINLFGIGSTDNGENGFKISGGGSGTVTLPKEKAVFLKEGLESSGFKVNETLYNFFKNSGTNPKTDWWKSSQTVLEQAKLYSDVAIVTVSRYTGENCDDKGNMGDSASYSFDQPFPSSYVDKDKDGRNFVQLSLKEEAMIDYCAKNYKKTIVLINSANSMELKYLDRDDVNAVLYVPYTGQSGTKQIGEILKGNVNPSGHLTDTLVVNSKDDPTYANAACNETNGRQINYAEDIYVGYKWYETAYHDGYFERQGKKYEDAVYRPFGYGLSYTTFKWEIKSTYYSDENDATHQFKSGDQLPKDTNLKIAIEVTNTGDKAGKDVLQLYGLAPYTKGGIEKPYEALIAYDKTKVLYPSSQADADHPNKQTIVLDVDPYYLASYDCYDKNNNGFKGYELEGGDYSLRLQTDAHTTKDSSKVEVKFTIPADGYLYDKDSVSGNEVSNRFTGEKAEAGVPIDGNGNDNDEITYLSRADFEKTFPKTETTPRTNGYDITKDGIYIDDATYYPEAKRPTMNKVTDKPLYLYTLKDGKKAYWQALNKDAGAKEIVPNEELIMKLGKDYDAAEWDTMLDQLSYRDMAQYICLNWQKSNPIESIGKPLIKDMDGPSGVANAYLSPKELENVSAFACSLLVGMTWNKDIAFNEGVAMAGEFNSLGISGAYAPAVDLHRHAYNGRNYEQYSEDALLSGTMGAKVVNGMVTHGLSGSVKHFVLSQPGMNPSNYNTWVTEQNLRENYLRPFEIAVKEGEANFIMTSFNNIGGVKCAYSYELINGVLREEWGFKGSVITDYSVGSKTRTTANLIRSGNDLRFIGPDSSSAMQEVSEDNDVDVYLLRRATKNALYSFCNTYYKSKTYNPNYKTAYVTYEQPFVWWIPTLVALDVVLVAGAGLSIFFAFHTKKDKKKKIAKNSKN